MQTLSYIAHYMQRPKRPAKGVRQISINLITNFTDDVLERVLGGMCITEGIFPSIVRAPYKQYSFALKNKQSVLYRSKPDITFIFFDASPYRSSEFLSEQHRIDVLEDIERYAHSMKGSVVVSLFALPYQGAYGHFFTQDPLFIALSDFNTRLRTLAGRNPSIHLFDAAKVVHRVGEMQARDLRGYHAFDMPFANDFLSALASEWLAYIRALLGISRKAIVLDLDNTLWGGVMGEEGSLGIKLGPDYPGLAYQNFQRALLSLWERGIILAINSKNNREDVLEVFKKNPHMILREEHFAAIRTNWDDKSKNIVSIAKEINIGVDSMVFLDDSPLERERMRDEVPAVLTPEWSFEPEYFVRELFSLNVFHQMSLTEEDKKKGKMYTEEQKRKKIQTLSKNVDDYIKQLNISIKTAWGSEIDIARAAQLTQKTNQFNLTTKRYIESDIDRIIKRGGWVVTGEVRDVFGEYGIVILAIVTFKKSEAILDTFLMSCRVMGRGVEQAFLKHLLEELRKEGVQKCSAIFVPTAKNVPAADFLSNAGFKLISSKKNKIKAYSLDVKNYTNKLTAAKQKPIISITS